MFNKGDKVRVVDDGYATDFFREGDILTVTQTDKQGWVYVGTASDGWLPGRFELFQGAEVPLAEWEKELLAEHDNVNHPQHYKFSNGAEVISISENLTANAAQVVQYVARSSRLDGKNKGNVLEDLRKAQWFLQREIERVGA